MFDYCSQKYKDLLHSYGDFNLYSHFNLNFLTITNDILALDNKFVLRKRYVCFLDDINLIKEKNDNLRFLLNNCVITFTPYEIFKINGCLDRFIFFNPVFDENEFTQLNLGDRSLELIEYDVTQNYTLDYLKNVKFINFNMDLDPTDYFFNKTLLENVLKCLLCGCMVNIKNEYLQSMLEKYTIDRVNKSIFEYDSYVYCSSKILEKYSYAASVDLIDKTIISIFGNCYDFGS